VRCYLAELKAGKCHCAGDWSCVCLMDLTLSQKELAFRDELRDWLSTHSAGSRPKGEEAEYQWRRDWLRVLAAGRWAGVHWPAEYGGRGASVVESAIFFEELGHSGAPLPANVLGLLLAGPTIMTWGSDLQRERYLPQILSGDEIWCQGFSEPEAGSDLAAVRTRAVADGDLWRITGQKVWTSDAQYAKRCMLLARSGPIEERHKSLTYFLLDMEQPGVQVRPLRQMTGETEFNELFLEEAIVPTESVLGGIGNGWKVAMTTLMNERSGLAFFLQVRLRQLFDDVVKHAIDGGLCNDPVVTDRLAAMHNRVEVLRLTALRGLTAAGSHRTPGPEGVLTKWMWSTANQDLTQLAIDVVGPVCGLDRASDWAYELLRARGNSIEGGTTEILKNIIAERSLGLPRLR
jgi:alkylation response protein AidB-like acyl-CoA dehydrogenase